MESAAIFLWSRFIPAAWTNSSVVNVGRGAYRAQKGRVEEACKRNNVIASGAAVVGEPRDTHDPFGVSLLPRVTRSSSCWFADRITTIYTYTRCARRWASSGCLVSRVGEWDTGAGPVGSTDIKIYGHTGREVTRFFIVVQVQQDSEWYSAAASCFNVLWAHLRDNKSYTSVLLYSFRSYLLKLIDWN